MTDSSATVKNDMLKHVSAAITEVQAAINSLVAVHPIASDTDTFKALSKERDNLRSLLPQITRMKLS